MKLTAKEQAMLAGEHGAPVQKSMELLVTIGELFEAERMVEVSHVHVAATTIHALGKECLAYVQDLADQGARFAVPSTANTSSTDQALWQRIGVSKAWNDLHLEMERAYESMGVLMSYSCAPYQLGHIPRLGEHIAWGEAAAIVYANSVLGARTNREGGPSCIAAAITGRVPLYGYHLTEDRRGTHKVVVSARLTDSADYGALGYYVGKIVKDASPVFAGIPADAAQSHLKALGTALSCSGAVALFHVVGVTPEAATQEQAFNGRKVADSDTILFTEKELSEVREELSKSDTDKIDLVLLGCPHASIVEIREIAALLGAHKARPAAEIWIYTSAPIKAYADWSGYTKTIEHAGGRIVCGTCALCVPKDAFRNIGHKVVATNAAKLAHHVPGSCGLKVHFGSTDRCIKAAVTGRWS